jgi:hypothetical protein
VNFYLDRFGLFPPLIHEHPPKDVYMSVVIPCHREDDLLNCLISLRNCTSTERSVEVIIVINHSQVAEEETIRKNEFAYKQATIWSEKNNAGKLKFFPLLISLPDKDAGVGLARKAGMDEAVRRFKVAGIKDGVIVCLDADCTVSKSYLYETEKYFLTNKKINAASIYFEHPLDSVTGIAKDSIIEYEIFLRYYVNGLRSVGHPFAYQTIGSSMAVRTEVYQKQGGMNKRKAGEDFYFLQKIFLLGNFGEINSCTVFPSCRSSDRVPFGTGKAIGDALSGKPIMFYDPKVFSQISTFIKLIRRHHINMNDDLMSEIPSELLSFLDSVNFNKKNREIISNVGNMNQYEKRFFAWFDGFMILKAVHYLSDNYFPRRKLSDCKFDELFPNMNLNDAYKVLKVLRANDRNFKLSLDTKENL